MQDELKIIGIQMNVTWENPTKNLHFLETKINSFSAIPDLIVLPEMFATGFTMNPEKNAETMEGISISWMQKTAIDKQIAICGSLAITENGKFYNRFVFVFPSGKIKTYDKRHCFTLSGEDKAYTAGKNKLIIDYKGWKISPLICYDLRFPVWARNTENYDLLIYMANWPVTRINAWDTLLKARAIENISYVVGVNRVGADENGYEYSGNSLIIDFLGKELTNLKDNENGIITATLNKVHQDKTRNKLGFLNDRDSFDITPF